MTRKPNSYDIARHAGVSQTTVSFVLNGRADMPISAATRDRVLAAARELGYRPNRSARAIQSGRFGAVALLGSTHPSRSVLPDALRDGIQDALAELDLHLLLARLSDSALTDEKFVPAILREWSADGLLINYNAEVPAAMETLISGNHLPSVWINAKRDADCVYPDDFEAARRGTDLLLARGHRRIAFVQYTTVTHYSAVDRLGGYTTAMRDAGLTPRVIAPPEMVLSVSTAVALLSEPPGERPTAFLCYGGDMAIRLQHAAALRGLSCPRDLSLLAFDYKATAALSQRVDTLELPEYEMGKQAVEMVVRKIADPATLLSPRPLICRHAPGETLSDPPS